MQVGDKAVRQSGIDFARQETRQASDDSGRQVTRWSGRHPPWQARMEGGRQGGGHNK